MAREDAQRRSRDMRERGLDLARTLVHVISVEAQPCGVTGGVIGTT